jgi:hypothetical protein
LKDKGSSWERSDLSSFDRDARPLPPALQGRKDIIPSEQKPIIVTKATVPSRRPTEVPTRKERPRDEEDDPYGNVMLSKTDMSHANAIFGGSHPVPARIETTSSRTEDRSKKEFIKPSGKDTTQNVVNTNVRFTLSKIDQCSCSNQIHKR